MNQETHNPGNMHLEEDHGTVWMMRSNVIGSDKLICNSEALSKAVLVPGAPVLYKNKPVGVLHSMRYNRLDGFLVGFFTLSISRDSLPETQYLYGIPKYDFDQIQCISCQTVFRLGSDACECIFNAPVIQIPRITFTGVSIYNGMHDDINMRDARSNLLNKYFGGVIGSIRTQDEEF